MLDKEAIIAAIGADRYKETCKKARKAAPQTGRRDRTVQFNSRIPSKIVGMIWGGRAFYEPEARQEDINKVRLVFQFYQEMPCYSLMLDFAMHYPDLSPDAKVAFWDHVRALLSQEDEALSQPIEYSMWCDYLESPHKVEEAWIELTQDISNTRLIQRLLIASGPVPFRLKEALYEQLIGNQQWHYFIYRSLLHSRFDYFGKINVPKARSILQRLDVPEDSYLENLRETLETDEDVPEEIQYQAKAKHGIMSKLEHPNNESQGL